MRLERVRIDVTLGDNPDDVQAEGGLDDAAGLARLHVFYSLFKSGNHHPLREPAEIASLAGAGPLRYLFGSGDKLLVAGILHLGSNGLGAVHDLGLGRFVSCGWDLQYDMASMHLVAAFARLPLLLPALLNYLEQMEARRRADRHSDAANRQFDGSGEALGDSALGEPAHDAAALPVRRIGVQYSQLGEVLSLQQLLADSEGLLAYLNQFFRRRFVG